MDPNKPVSQGFFHKVPLAREAEVKTPPSPIDTDLLSQFQEKLKEIGKCLVLSDLANENQSKYYIGRVKKKGGGFELKVYKKGIKAWFHQLFGLVNFKHLSSDGSNDSIVEMFKEYKGLNGPKDRMVQLGSSAVASQVIDNKLHKLYKRHKRHKVSKLDYVHEMINRERHRLLEVLHPFLPQDKLTLEDEVDDYLYELKLLSQLHHLTDEQKNFIKALPKELSDGVGPQKSSHYLLRKKLRNIIGLRD